MSTPPAPALPSVGIDLVHIPALAQQLAQPGSRMRQLLSPQEHRRAATRVGDEVEFFAGRYAAKEAIIKAWEQALVGRPPVIAPEQLKYADISITPDPHGRLVVELRGELARAFADSCPGARIQVSISHDGDYATAIAHIQPA